MPGETVLVIDDDSKVVMMLREMLPDYEFKSALTAEEGLSHLKSAESVDLVIVDYKLGAVSGIEVLRKIKRSGLGLGVIMLTAYGTKNVIVESLESEADAFIDKPIDFDLLKEKIDKVLKKTHYFKEPSTIAHIINTAKRKLDEQPGKNLTLRDFSKKGAFNEKYLSRAFKEKTGYTFTQYRLIQKMNRAKRLLENPSMSLTQISELLGYYNPSAFMKMFKKVVGITPSSYRRKSRSSSRSA